MSLVCSYYHACFHMWKLKHRDAKKFTQDNMAHKSWGWGLNLGRIYPFNHLNVLSLYGRNI